MERRYPQVCHDYESMNTKIIIIMDDNLEVTLHSGVLFIIFSLFKMAHGASLSTGTRRSRVIIPPGKTPHFLTNCFNYWKSFSSFILIAF